MGCQYFSPTANGADSFTVAMPKLTFGRGCLAEAGPRALTHGMKRVALFTDSFLLEGPYVEIVKRSLAGAGLDTVIYADVRIEPCDATVMAAAEFLRGDHFDGVVSVGGGSVMDTAKAAMAYALYPAEFLDYFGPPIGQGKPVPGPVLPHLACPTTSGTGAECTSLSVIRINELNTKFVIASPHILPTEALVDPACCASLPANVVASTGFDLLSHAIECYTARAYTQWDRVADPVRRQLIQGANPWSDLAAREALQLVGRYLVRGVADATDTEARDHLMWAATLAGMAFGNSGTHLPHAMSYGVTHLMHDVTTRDYAVASPFVPHGISVILNAPAIFRYTAEAAPQRHLAAANYLGANCEQAADNEAGEVVAARIIELMKNTALPNGLGEIGFSSGDVKALTESTIRQKRAISNCPRETNATDIENMYRGALSYW
jgi:hydroxyacid-oxoacid transhydrogenase